MEKKYKELHKKIDEILWNDWDPIGVNDIECIRNEYSSYVPYIVNLKMKGADVEKITRHLFHLESESMGMNGNIERCKEIAQKIITLKS
ncbi:hypothetical protein [Massilibacteroides vaginae]|uniref:hypothetical protein n=1 Tax=Massilibacteroides vaginae TaxID=1673718 RepID=UPI000A1CE460|nr:hypothetical protein [Massilibacteroides vaginae]